MDGRDDGFLVGQADIARDSQPPGFPYTRGTRGVPDMAFFRHTNTNAHKFLFIYTMGKAFVFFYIKFS